MQKKPKYDWREIRAYYEAGHTLAECQRRFGFSNGAWDQAVGTRRVIPRPKWSDTRTSEKRAEIARLREAGISYTDISRTLGLSKATVAYHARRLGVPADDRCARRYDWREIQLAYDSGLTARGCAARFGFNLASWHAAKKRGDIVPRPTATTTRPESS